MPSGETRHFSTRRHGSFVHTPHQPLPFGPREGRLPTRPGWDSDQSRMGGWREERSTGSGEMVQPPGEHPPQGTP